MPQKRNDGNEKINKYIAFDTADLMPLNPNSLWHVISIESREKIRDFLRSRENGIAIYRAFRELGYRDFFGFCLGLTACYNEKDISEDCGRIILSRYSRNTGTAESKFDYRLRDPKPSYEFAQQVLGVDFCVTEEFVKTISDFIDFISVELCSIGEMYCREVNNFNTLKNIRTRSVFSDSKTNSIFFY